MNIKKLLMVILVCCVVGLSVVGAITIFDNLASLSEVEEDDEDKDEDTDEDTEDDKKGDDSDINELLGGLYSIARMRNRIHQI